MKAILALAMLSFVLLQTPANLPEPSGLRLVQLSSKEKLVENEPFRRMVSNQAPVLHPTLLRDETDIREIGSPLHQEGSGVSFPARFQHKVYLFRAQLENHSSKLITRFVWAYRLPQSSTNPQDISDQEYLCDVRIEPGDTKRIKVISPIPRERIVNASASGTPPAPQQPSLKDMIINQVQFADDTKWQRPNWNPIILSQQGAKKLAKGKCLGL